MNSNNFYKLINEFQTNIDWLNQILKGRHDETVTIDGIAKPSISKDIADKYNAIGAMVHGRKAYEKLSDLPNTPPEDIYLAEVWNDQQSENNGLYGWNGSSWERSPYNSDLTENRYNSLKALSGLDSKEALSRMPLGSGYSWAVVDDDKNVLLGITEDGRVVGDLDIDLGSEVLTIPIQDDDRFAWAISDEDGNVIAYVDHQGCLHYQSKDNNIDIPIPLDDYLTGFADEKGTALLIFDKSGAAYSPAASYFPMPYVTDNEIRSSGGGDRLVAKIGSSQILNSRPLNNQFVQAVIKNGITGFTQRVRGRIGANQLIPDDFETLHTVIVYGQSLSVGAQGQPLVTTTAPFNGDVLMFAGPESADIRMGMSTIGDRIELDPDSLTGFQDLIAASGQGGGNRGETVGEALGYGLAEKARENDTRWHGLFFAPGFGGTAYTGLKKGTIHYENMLAALRKAVELADKERLHLVVDAIILLHGEGDSSNPDYYDNLLEWQADIDADVRTITAQVGSVPFIMSQPSSFSGSTTGTNAVKAIYKAQKESQQHYVIAPNYDLPYSSDLLHLAGPGYHLLGEKTVQAFQDIIWQGVGWKPVMPVSVLRTGVYVDVIFNVPEGAITLDTVTVSNPGQWGFSYVDDSSETAISGISVMDDNRVRLTLAKTPDGDNAVLRYGLSGHSGDRSEATIPRGNIRDSSKSFSKYDGRPLHNWCVHFEEPVNEG